MRGRRRIITLQMQARELGRLRAGVFEKPAKGKGRPKRSDTWIVTSASEDYVTAAANEWGGTAERWKPQGNGAEQWRVITGTPVVDAVLPPNDTLSQAYEMWSRGGCQRRCDGATEELSGQACPCRQQWGEEFGARDDIPDGQACQPTTRLSVILPALPDLGVFRVETHGYYAAMEIVGTVDTIRGIVGPDVMVPVRLRIEQRTRVAAGQTKQYSVIVVELRGATSGQILGGDTSGMIRLDPTRGSNGAAQVGGSGRRAIEAAPSSTSRGSWWSRGAAVETLEDMRALWAEANDAGALHADPELVAFLKDRGEQIAAATPVQGSQSPADVPEGEDGEPAGGAAGGGGTEQPPPPADADADADADGDASPDDDSAERIGLWNQVMATAGAKGANTKQVNDEWAAFGEGQLWVDVGIEVCREFTRYVQTTDAFANGQVDA